MKVKSITSPKRFYIKKDLILEIGELTEIYGKKPYVVIANSMKKRHEEDLKKSFGERNMDYRLNVFAGECSDVEIQRHMDRVRDLQSDFIIGFGGGKTLDTAKLVAHNLKLPVVIVPSLASTDAPCTALSVVYNEDGSFNRYEFLPHNPDAVYVDSQIIANAPIRFFAAGVGDGLATYFEARATMRSEGVNLTLNRPSKAGLVIAEGCLANIDKYLDQAMDSVRTHTVTRALENVIEATVYMSGVGAEACGCAAAHAIHNGMTVVEDLHGAQHGEKVAFGTVAQLILEAAPDEEIELVTDIMRRSGLPFTLEDMGMKEFKESEWRQAAENACAEGETIYNQPFEIRPDFVYDAIVTANALLHRIK